MALAAVLFRPSVGRTMLVHVGSSPLSADSVGDLQDAPRNMLHHEKSHGFPELSASMGLPGPDRVRLVLESC